MTSEEDITKYIYSNLRETHILAQNCIAPQGNTLPRRSPYANIEKYVRKFLSADGSNSEPLERWLVLPGLRGTGKTTIVFQIYDYLINYTNVNKEDVLYLPANEVKNYLGTGIREVILQFIRDIHRTTLVELDKKIFVLIDEAHFDKNWDETIAVLYNKTVGKNNLFFIVTGSSSIALEMSTDSVRRKIKRSIFPMNFQEYLKLKYDFYPPGKTADLIRDVVFNGPNAALGRFSGIETNLHKKLLDLPKSADIELEDFIYSGGFPFSLNMQPFLTYERVAELVDKIVCDDLSQYYNFKIENRTDIIKILMFLALKPPGEVSQQKLAMNLGISSARVNQTLDALERTHLIISIKPYQGAKGIVRDAWKYYFLSPTIKASLLYKYGKFDRSDRVMYGELVENLVASYFFRMMKTIDKPTGIFYDPGREGADFLLTYGEKVIPVEVCCGKKDKKQTHRTGKRIKKVKHKIIISNEEKSKQEEDVFYIPLKTFLFS